MSLVLGLDVGTQGTKGLVIDDQLGEVVARASSSYALIDGLETGAAEQHPETWIEAVRAVCRELIRQPQVERAEVRAVGVSGQQHGLVVLDEAQRVVRPAKLWCDTATAAEAEQLAGELGRPVPTGFTASKVRWLAQREPESWERTRHVLLPHDFVNLRLTGEISAEAGDASGTGFFDVEARGWDLAAARCIAPDLPGRLPPLVAEGEPAGRLSTAGAELTGLGEGTLVAAGGGDNMMSAVGSGATRPGVVTLSLGTSGTVFSHSDTPVIDPAGLIAPFCSSVGGWLPLLCVMNLTGVTEEVRELTGRTHRELTEAASAVPAGCDDLLWLPYLSGERVPDLPRATGTLLGLRPGHLRPAVLYRAALEGTSLNLAWGVERLRTLGVTIESVNLVGGAARNPLWRQILAACLNAPVQPLAEPESAALGAAVQALWILRRAQVEAVTADTVARPFVRPDGEASLPDRDEVELYAQLGLLFRSQVTRLYGA